MSTKTAEIAKMIDMLPDSDKELAYELIKKLVLACDPAPPNNAIMRHTTLPNRFPSTFFTFTAINDGIKPINT